MNDNEKAIEQVIETTKVCIQKIIDSDEFQKGTDAVEYFNIHPVDKEYKEYRGAESLITEISRLKGELLKIQERRKNIIEYKFSLEIYQIKYYLNLALGDIIDADCKQSIQDIRNTFNNVGERNIVRETLRHLHNDLRKILPKIPSDNRNGLARLDIEAVLKKIEPLLDYKAASID